MKNTYTIIGVIVAIAILAFIFGSKKSEAPEILSPVNSANLQDGSYELDLENSSIRWTIDYPSGSSEPGSLSFKSGSIMLASGSPFAGTFEVDVDTLRTDSNIVLQNFLKAPNFLDADNYPAITFVISKIIPNPVSGTSTGKYIIDGKMTVKDRTNPISFPGTFSQVGNKLSASSSFALNKIEWGIDSKEIKDAVLIEIQVEFWKK